MYVHCNMYFVTHFGMFFLNPNSHKYQVYNIYHSIDPNLKYLGMKLPCWWIYRVFPFQELLDRSLGLGSVGAADLSRVQRLTDGRVVTLEKKPFNMQCMCPVK